MLLKNKNIVLTGASGILGKNLSQELLNEGANLALIDIDKTSLLKLKKELNYNNKQNVVFYNINLTEENAVIDTVKDINEKLGSIDVLHNNAATKGQSLEKFLTPYEDYELSTWDEVMTGNLTSMFLMSREVIKFMKKQKSGSIIQTASIYGVVSPKKEIYEGSSYNGFEIQSPAIYSVSKSAIIGLTKYLASYLGEYNIRVNSISPGGIFSGQNSTFVDKYSKQVPLGRMTSIKDIFGAVLFLSSDQSLYITGQNIMIDGGFSL